MREIKFRAWDKVDGMKTFNFDDLYYNTVNIDHGVYDVPIMQYTGLQDRNGKDIYEGDIVEWNYGVFEVIWETFMFNLKDFYDASSDYPTIAFSEGVFEVIGNIYENPDLLKDIDPTE